MEDYAIEIDHVTIRFNMASEKVDNLKEYIIKLVKIELIPRSIKLVFFR